jgi:hypothetical protein
LHTKTTALYSVWKAFFSFSLVSWGSLKVLFWLSLSSESKSFLHYYICHVCLALHLDLYFACWDFGHENENGHAKDLFLENCFCWGFATSWVFAQRWNKFEQQFGQHFSGQYISLSIKIVKVIDRQQWYFAWKGRYNSKSILNRMDLYSRLPDIVYFDQYPDSRIYQWNKFQCSVLILVLRQSAALCRDWWKTKGW